MKDEFILTLIHRPEMAPEYAQKLTQSGKKDELGDDALLDESLQIFLFQQECAHSRGLKTTIEMTYASLFNPEIIRLAKEHHDRYGDEIALTLLGLPCPQFEEKYKTKDFCIWMFSDEDKKAIVDDCFALFKEKFGFYPASTGSYYLDAFTINYIKEKYPSVVCAVATCFEEGVKAYHTTNNSWYTFMDGGPWAPWIPSKINSAIPAENEAEDSGIVAIPHLSRDPMACFDGNGSNFGTHPQNVLRGMIYKDNEIPYFYNLVDMFRHQAKYNDGHAYNMMFVGPGWLNKLGRWEAPYELLKKSYEDALTYYGKLKKEGKLIDMTMEEYAAHYRKEHPDYKTPEVALWKDILYGSDKQYFWYYDPYLRCCLDFNQGGAMIDLRNYAAKLEIPVGIGTGNAYNASYPYLVQANYRAGYFTHYAGQGTLKSAQVKYGDEIVDLALERTMATYSKEGEDTVLTTDPFEVAFSAGSLTMQSRFVFKKGEGKIVFERIILDNPNHLEVEIEDYLVATYGKEEYSLDMTGITLGIEGKDPIAIDYLYKYRHIEKPQGVAYANVPQIQARVEVGGEDCAVRIEEGIAFSPMFRLSAKRTLKEGRISSWLKLAKAN
ncbi:MAG: hypothetical protein IJU64_01285 [Bacilli bacterium]|nr:hypothetical protein [Bacilli bacterium]